MSSMDVEGFYEDDEQMEDIVKAFEEGEKGLTGQERRGETYYLSVGGFGFGGFVQTRGNEPAARIPSRH
jgi:hypothetical protein